MSRKHLGVHIRATGCVYLAVDGQNPVGCILQRGTIHNRYHRLLTFTVVAQMVVAQHVLEFLVMAAETQIQRAGTSLPLDPDLGFRRAQLSQLEYEFNAPDILGRHGKSTALRVGEL